MKINVGSKNEVKVSAVRESFLEFDEFKNINVSDSDVDSGVSTQPKSLEETIQGAINRAKNAFHGCDLSVGIESGILKVPNTKSGYMDISVCVIYDGKQIHMGTSSLFEYPKKMIDLVLNNGHEISVAAKHMGFSEDHAIGTREGVIGYLTKGKLNRKSYTKQAVTTALIHLINPEHY